MSESSTSNTMFEDMMLVLFAILLAGQMFQRGPEILQERFGVSFEGESQYLVAGVALSADTPHGTAVNVPNGASFYTAPGEGEPSGTFAPGTSLVVVGGPETVDGERWWQVEDPATGNMGWVRESNLIQEGAGGIGPATKVGAKARMLLDTTAWTEAGGTVKAAILSKGDLGELTKGPKKKNGSRWWFFDKDSSSDDGWVPEAALLLASDTGWKEGTKVQGGDATSLFERAGDGQVTGLLSKGEKATILGGPVEVQGEMWWLIKTEDGEEGWVKESDLESTGIKTVVKKIIIIIMVIGALATLILLGGIVYVTIRTNQVRAREVERIKSAIPKKTEEPKNERWIKIEEHVASENPNDWRLAIIEADIMLDEVVTKMGYYGDTLGEKLKQVAKGDIEYLDALWEAHKVRNQIAHEGSDFILTQREAKRVVGLYATAFRELRVI